MRRILVLPLLLVVACGRDSPPVPTAPPPPPPLPRPPALEIETCGPSYTDLRFSEVPGATVYVFERRYREHGQWEPLTRRDARLLSRYSVGPDGTDIYRYLDYEPYRDGIRVSIWYRVRAELADGRETEWSELWYCQALPIYETPTTDHRFDRPFWGQMAFNAHECPTPASCPSWSENGDPIPLLENRVLYVLSTTSPNFHIRASGFSQSELRTIRNVIPDAVSALTGELFFGQITEGADGDLRDGWILIEHQEEEGDSEACGRARIGAPDGHIRLDMTRTSVSGNRGCWLEGLLRHEIGHALGFFHVPRTSDMMHRESTARSFSARETYHAQLAYEAGRGTPYSRGPMTTSTGTPTPEPAVAVCSVPLN